MKQSGKGSCLNGASHVVFVVLCCVVLCCVVCVNGYREKTCMANQSSSYYSDVGVYGPFFLLLGDFEKLTKMHFATREHGVVLELLCMMLCPTTAQSAGNVTHNIINK